MGKLVKSFSFWVFFITLALSYWAGLNIAPTMVISKVTLDVKQVDVGEDTGKLYYIYKGKSKFIEPVDNLKTSEKIELYNMLSTDMQSLL